VKHLEQDLLLLMLNLSRMQDRDRIVRLYVEALCSTVPGVTVRRLAEGEPEGGGELLEIATPGAAFGRLVLEDPQGKLSPTDRARLRNATRMLAVVLENTARAERLSSENARLDAAVAERTAELQQALARSEDLYQHAPCGYHSLDENAVYVRVNDTELRWLGYERDELVGKKKFTDLVSPGSLVRFLHGFASVKTTGAPLEGELELVCKDGASFPVLMRASAVLDEAGKFVASRATMFDLSERRRAERTLRDTEERFRQSQKLEALGRLAGGVAHDFNNLLTVIVSCSEVILDSLPPADQLREDAAEIADAAAKAAQLTRQLLAFGRRQPANPVPLDLGETVAGMEKMLRRLIGEDVELLVSRQPGLMPVMADPGRFEQVVLNLVVNARDAMPAGGRIVLETTNTTHRAGNGLDLPPGPYVRLAVSDTGTGMSGEVRSHLFEPFFTTKAEGKGTGLGLATVYGIVKQAGGEVKVDSEPGRGSRFEVLLPAAPAEAALEAEGRGGDEVQGGSETILLVEDEARVRAAEAQMLRRAGYTVIEAPDGETAVGCAGAGTPFDVLVTDLVMPRLGGAALAAKLRKLRGPIPVVFVSGYGGEVLAGDDLGEGTAAVLQKPFTAGALTRAIRAQLAAARGRAPQRGAAPPPVTPESRR
jgi:PAS domain S-box-containing protein